MKNKKTSYTLLDYYNLFLKYKKFILIITLVVSLASALVYFVILDPIYLSQGSVKSTSKTSGLAGMLASTGLSGLGDVSDLAGGGTGASELALYDNILSSRRCIEETIIKFNLIEVYHEKYMQDAVKYFRENIMEINKDKIAGTLSIGVYDKDPQRAKEIVEFLISKLNQINTEMNILNANNNREFIEGRYNQIKKDLTLAEDSLKQYQEKFGFAPDVTVKAVLQSQVLLEGDIKSEEIKLDLLKKVLSPDQDEVKMQMEKINSMKKKLDEIKNSDTEGSLLKLKGSPEIVLNYLRLQRNVEIQNKILAYVIPLLEQAKIDEKKDTPVVIVLDYPSVPEKKTKPKRLTMVLVFTLAGFLLSYSGFFIKDKITELLTDPNDQI